MDEVNKHELNWKAYVWRGTLGGVIGNVILELLGTMYLVVRFGANYLHDGLIIGLVSALIGGAIIGLAVGFVIYKVTQRWGKQPKGAVRVAIGSTCFLAYFLLPNLTKVGLFSIAFSFAYAILVGGFAGLMARTENYSASVPISASRA